MHARAYFALLFLAALAFASLTGCSSAAQSQPPDEENSETAIPVEAAFVEIGAIDAVLTGTASLEAEEEASVVARAGGVVTAIYAEEGRYVEAGDPLVQLDDERLTLELRRAAVTLEKLRLEHERKSELYEKQLISTEEYQAIQSDYELQQQVHDLAQLELAYTTVRAPISGIVSQRAVKVGNMIQQNDVTFHITDFQPLLAIMHVPERELHKLHAGQRATIQVDALPDGRFDGYIKRISPVIDAATGTFEVTIEVRDTSGRLKPGMFGRVFVVHDTHENALLLPKSAVIREDDEAAVFVIRDSVTFRQPVVTGFENESSIEIVSGVVPGDQIVVTGQAGLRDSSRVEVIDS